MNRRILSFVLVLFSPLSAYALVVGGSNLGFGGYPSHSCSKPMKPYKPYSFNNQWEVDSYNSEVDSYNSDLRQYMDCIDDYIENANNDIRRIKEKADEAIFEASH